MTTTTKKPDPAQGIYLRWQTYWLKHRAEDGQYYFANLQTSDLAEAIKKAAPIRGVIPAEKKPFETWEKTINQYLDEKTKGIRPAHLSGKRLRQFRTTSCVKVRSVIKVFARKMNIDTPAKVKFEHLQKYYDECRKSSESGARNRIATLHAFLDHINCLSKRVTFAANSKPECRQQVMSIAKANELIDKCTDEKLKYVLFCGFHCGMRKGEIQHSRREWFDMDNERRILTIPGKDTTNLPTGARNVWQPKDGEARDIPLGKDFYDFLTRFFEKKKDYCLSSRISKDGVYDFRAPYEKFMKETGNKGFTIHAMRHSWISEICNSGNHSILEVSAWSGDTLETIQKNYWHKKTQPRSLDSTLEGRKKGQDIAEMLQAIKAQAESNSEEDMKLIMEEIVKLQNLALGLGTKKEGK